MLNAINGTQWTQRTKGEAYEVRGKSGVVGSLVPGGALNSVPAELGTFLYIIIWLLTSPIVTAQIGI